MQNLGSHNIWAQVEMFLLCGLAVAVVVVEKREDGGDGGGNGDRQNV